MNKKLHPLFFAIALATTLLLTSSPAMAESGITLESEQTTYEPTARIHLTGTLDPGDYFYEPVRLTVYDASGNELVHAKSIVDDEQFSVLITGPYGSFDEGTYMIEATHVSTMESANVEIEISNSVNELFPYAHLTPLEQIEIGTAPSQVVCNGDDVLLQNNHRLSVACVNPSTAVVLDERGWGEPF